MKEYLIKLLQPGPIDTDYKAPEEGKGESLTQYHSKAPRSVSQAGESEVSVGCDSNHWAHHWLLAGLACL